MTTDLRSWLRSPRFLFGAALFAVLIYVGLQPFYARLLVIDRGPMASALALVPDHRTPGYPALLGRAADVIPEGESVAVVFPSLDWNRGYSYAYFRAQYLLPGRRVVPLGWPDGPRPERLADAEWVIVFAAPVPTGEWTVVAELENGRIVRRGR